MSVSIRRWLLVVGAFAAGLVVGLGPMWWPLLFQPSVLISSGPEWYSYIAGRRLVARLSEADMAASPKWHPNGALPLRPEEAIAMARESLPALDPSVGTWSFSAIALHEESPEKRQRFYYTVTFRPNAPPPNTDWVHILVYFNGNVTLPTSAGRAP